MQCLICGAEAEDLTPGDFDGVIARCKRCGEYEVPATVLNGLLRLDYDLRVKALENAKAVTEGTRPSIMSTDVLGH